MVLLWVASVFAFATLIAVSRTRSWPAELFSHFRPHLIAAGVVVTAVCVVEHRYGVAALAFVGVLANAATFPKLLYCIPAPDNAASLCVLWANLWKREQALVRTIGYARKEGADVLLFAEFPRVNDSWFAEHASDYPHVLISQVSDAAFTSNVAILSKLPLERCETIVASPLEQRPLQSAHVRCGDALLQINAIHPAAPGTPHMLRDRDTAIRMVFEKLAAPAIVAGDFNAAPWCPALTSAPVRVGNPLRESTWLTRLPLIGLPIDHLFITPSVRVSAYEVGPFLGSDHRALLARVHI
ncbi:MAG: endonuclease/exonuclease/phosphatase family protein [Hyphomonadaceae bacterium]|nr:endonuclease/exonuclease/phosphatase family protein [Hyphomonadaceae bacterium]